MTTPEDEARTDETWHRLREWSYGQTPSERLAALMLDEEGFTDIDPSHPLGGKDGGRDGECTRDSSKWTWAVYFPRGQQDFTTIEKKLKDDIAAARNTSRSASRSSPTRNYGLPSDGICASSAGTLTSTSTTWNGWPPSWTGRGWQQPGSSSSRSHLAAHP